jgi:Phosphoglucose isomerase
MPLPVQNIFPGNLAKAFADQLQQFERGNIVQRLWKLDRSLWLAEEHELRAIESNLSFLTLPEKIGSYISRVAEVAGKAQAEGLDHVVIVGLGGANLAAAAVLHASEVKPEKQVFLLDTTDPGTLGKLNTKLPLERTLFVFASKSGKRIETHALLLYFLDRLKRAGTSRPGSHFIAFTDENSYLATLASEYRFRDLFLDPPGISSRYSGVIHFGVLLTAISGLQPSVLTESILAMQEACGPARQTSENPAAALASFLAAGASQGLNRLILLSSDELNYFAYRIAQLVGISTSGEGRGLVPIFGGSSVALEILKRKCLVVILSKKSQPDGEVAPVQELRNLGIPVVQIDVQSADDFAAEIFKWEIATALACVPMGVNCFQQEGGQSNLGKMGDKAGMILAKADSTAPRERVKELSIALFVEGETRRLVSGLSVRDALQTFLELRDADGFVAICPFFELTPAYIAILDALRERMSKVTGVPVQIAAGPRYLYALDKIYKHGPARGIFIVITTVFEEDLAIPGAGYSFGEVLTASALTEVQALENFRRPAIRLHFSEGSEKGLKEFSDVVIQALARIRGSAG